MLILQYALKNRRITHKSRCLFTKMISPSQPFFRNEPEFAAGPDNESPDGERPDGERPDGERPESERPESERPGQQAASLFPLNINKMQVNLTGANAGVSFTIETHNTVAQQKPNYHVSMSHINMIKLVPLSQHMGRITQDSFSVKFWCRIFTATAKLN
jgi:hypothetical protein